MNQNQTDFPDNPVLVRLWRGEQVESQHRGIWTVVDDAGEVLDGKGDLEHPIFARSTVKCIQALPLLESGAAERCGLNERELAVALSSHNAEACHTDTVLGLLARLGLGIEHLQCGPQRPGDPGVRAELQRKGLPATALYNNCSGKHAGFLALAQHLDVPIASYLDARSEGQAMAHRALADMAGLRVEDVGVGIDGCSAPSFILPLRELATSFARVANPSGLSNQRAAHCRRMTSAAGAHPEMIAGNFRRLCTDISRVTKGRLFPKLGAEAVYLIGEVGGGRALGVKMDDGSLRGMHRVVLALLERFQFVTPEELSQLSKWNDPLIHNRAGLDVGHVEVLL